MPELDTILLKVASRCNLDCTYCYVYHMGDDNWQRQEKLMSTETIESVCKALRQLSQHQNKVFSVILHGGEPLMMGSSRLQDLLQRLREVVPQGYPISLQTNGTLLTEEIMDICSINKVSISVSIDGPDYIHDRGRIDRRGAGSFNKVMESIAVLKAHPDALFLFAGVLAVVDPESDPREVYAFFKSLGAPSVDFLYKDGNHSKLPIGKSSLESTEYGIWMTRLLEFYLADADPLPIRILDDMMKVILGGNVSKEGLGVTDFGILIIDTDGTVMKNDTLKSSYPGADRFDEPINVKDGDLVSFLRTPAFDEYRRLQRPSCQQCRKCPELSVCGGGMILHRWKVNNGFDNPSVYCSDQVFLIRKMRQILAKYLTHAGSAVS